MATLLVGGGGGGEPPSSSSSSILKSIENTVSANSISPEDTVVASRKRKRPPMLEIPLPPENPPEVAEPSTDPGVASEGSGWGAFYKRGRRKKTMEDFFHADPHKGFFGIFDGHGGRGAATYAARNLHENIAMTLKEYRGKVRKEDAIKAAFLKTDLNILEREDTGGGSCCVMALVGEEEIVVSNLGDCRAVICRDGAAEALTTDHAANNVDEQKRVQEKGGFIQDHYGTCRVQGTLAVTRSFGDSHLKQYLSAEPDTVLLPCSSDLDFLVLASDGLWDKVGNQEVVDAIIRHCSSITKGKDEKQKGDKQTECDGRSQEGIELVISSLHEESQKKCGIKPSEVEGLKFGPGNKRPQSISGLRGIRTQKVEKRSPFSSPSKVTDKENKIKNSGPPPKLRRIALGISSPFSCRDQKEDSSSRISEVTSVEERIIWTSAPNSHSGSILAGACEKVASIALDRGSADDITILIVDLKKHFTCHW